MTQTEVEQLEKLLDRLQKEHYPDWPVPLSLPLKIDRARDALWLLRHEIVPSNPRRVNK